MRSIPPQALAVAGLAARLILAAVWLTSGWVKATEPRETVVAVRAYQLLPDGLVRPVAGALPYAEIALGLLLLLGLATRLAAIGSAVLIVLFLIGVISAAARGLNIDCGCFGGGGAVEPGQTRYTVEILRDTGLLMLAGFLAYRPRTPLSVDGLVGRRMLVAADDQA